MPAIGLDHIHMRAKNCRKAVLQKLLPGLSIQGGLQADGSLFGENVHGYEGENFTKVDRIDLQNLPGSLRSGDQPPWLPFFPLRVQLGAFSQHLVDGGYTDLLVILPRQEVLDLLSATLSVPAPQLPDLPFELSIPLSFAPRASLGLVITIQKRSQATGYLESLGPANHRASGYL
ncbi:MAG: hypothetical protein ACRDFQ_09145 [Anaerolineales bacterium]